MKTAPGKFRADGQAYHLALAPYRVERVRAGSLAVET